MSETVFVVYELRLPDDHDNVPFNYTDDPTLVGAMVMEFDTAFCMPGRPFKIHAEGYVFTAEGIPEFRGGDEQSWVYTYRAGEA